MNEYVLAPLALIVLPLVAEVQAQSPQDLQDLRADHRYTEVITQVREGDVSAGEAYELGLAHLQRGYALRDLAQLQAEIGAAYYTKRDTSEAARSRVLTDYYAARYQLASPTSEVDAATLRRLARAKTLPARIQAQARVWLGLTQYRDGSESTAQETWSAVSETSSPAVTAGVAFAHWRAGEPLPALKCAGNGKKVAVLRCRLWTAVRVEKWGQAASLQRALLDRERDNAADVTQTFQTARGDSYERRFYDPGTLWVLAVSDFRAAASALQDAEQKRSSLLAGVAALEGRDFETARTALKSASPSPPRATYRAVLEEETSGGSAARSVWEKAERGPFWAQEASRYAAYQEAVRSYLREREAPERDRDSALRLGRAALSVGQARTALRLLRPAYPPNQPNNLREIDPAYIATFARAKFRLGPRYEAEVLGHLSAVLTEYPIASTLYDLAQGFYVPERVGGESRTGPG